MTENRIAEHLLVTRCRAYFCLKDGQPLFCPAHWKLVPKELQEEVASHYRAEFYDQRSNVRPTLDFVRALHKCRDALPDEGV